MLWALLSITFYMAIMGIVYFYPLFRSPKNKKSSLRYHSRQQQQQQQFDDYMDSQPLARQPQQQQQPRLNGAQRSMLMQQVHQAPQTQMEKPQSLLTKQYIGHQQ